MSSKEPKRYLSAEGMDADDFGDPFFNHEGEVVYDAKTKQGPWATMTEKSFRQHAVGKLGLGFGQKYRRTANGELHRVEG